jgi:hypothetical protein
MSRDREWWSTTNTVTVVNIFALLTVSHSDFEGQSNQKNRKREHSSSHRFSSLLASSSLSCHLGLSVVLSILLSLPSTPLTRFCSFFFPRIKNSRPERRSDIVKWKKSENVTFLSKTDLFLSCIEGTALKSRRVNVEDPKREDGTSRSLTRSKQSVDGK